MAEPIVFVTRSRIKEGSATDRASRACELIELIGRDVCGAASDGVPGAMRRTARSCVSVHFRPGYLGGFLPVAPA